METTLQAIKKCAPCPTGWRALLKHLGKTKADDAPISLLTILESNGFDDALWCLRAVEGFEREKRLFAVFCAKQVKHLMKDKRSLEALEVAERYANGLATDEELKEASDAASAAWAASEASEASEASDASAASAAARAASYAASDAHAASDAASSASSARAAWDASAASAASAAWAARAASYASDAARAASAASDAWAARAASAASAASAAIRTGQEKEFVRMLNCIENGEVYTI